MIPLLVIFSALFIQCQSDTIEEPPTGGTEQPEPEPEPEPSFPEKVIPKFIHSTYIVGNRLTGQKEIDETNYGKFSFIYLMAAPTWEVSDFDLEEDVIIKKYVTDYSYPTGASGISMAPNVLKKAQEMGSKVLLSFAGGDPYYQVAKNEARRVKLAKMMAQFIKKFNYDGIELDWEGNFDTELHITFMTAVRTELTAIEKEMNKPLFLTTALAEWRGYTEKQATALSTQIDWINIMTYDMGGGTWGTTPNHNTPLNIMKSRLQNNFKFFKPEKLCIGLANYGYGYKGLLPGVNVGAVEVAKRSRSLGYTNLMPLLDAGWTETWDEVAQAPFYFSPNDDEFITMDNFRSLDYKVEWIVEQKFAGEFWWVFNCDYIAAKPGEKYATNYLIDHVEEKYKELTGL